MRHVTSASHAQTTHYYYSVNDRPFAPCSHFDDKFAIVTDFTKMLNS